MGFFSDNKRAPLILEILRIILTDLKFFTKEMKIPALMLKGCLIPATCN